MEIPRVRHSTADAIRLDRDRHDRHCADALADNAAERRVSRVQAARAHGHTARGASEALREEDAHVDAHGHTASGTSEALREEDEKEEPSSAV